ncbi:MAG: hypothetical protein SPF99_00570 [Anaerobutyricum sp.]|nr:hypothetical protein [Anaerobutyricum sp.]
MTEEQKAGIQKLRTDGYGYTKIAGMLGCLKIRSNHSAGERD